MATFKVGDKVHLIPFEEALKLQCSNRPELGGDDIMGISEDLWNKLRQKPGEILKIWRPQSSENLAIFRLQFEIGEGQYKTLWFAEDSLETASTVAPMCPLLKETCKGKECAFWCDFGKMCSVPLLAGMFADSSVCQNVFEEENKQ